MTLDAILADLSRVFQFEERQQIVDGAAFTKAHEDLEDEVDEGKEVHLDTLLGPDREETFEKSVEMSSV